MIYDEVAVCIGLSFVVAYLTDES